MGVKKWKPQPPLMPSIRLQIYIHCGSWCEIMTAADKRLVLVENSQPGVGEVTVKGGR